MGLGDGMDGGVLIDGQCTVRGLDGGAVQDLVGVKRTPLSTGHVEEKVTVWPLVLCPFYSKHGV